VTPSVATPGDTNLSDATDPKKNLLALSTVTRCTYFGISEHSSESSGWQQNAAATLVTSTSRPSWCNFAGC